MKRVDHLSRDLLLKLFSTKKGSTAMCKEYVYIFVRQDMSKEQQLVQSAHATLVLGHKLKNRKDVSELYYAVIGVANLLELAQGMKHLQKRNHEFVTFYEPDQGNTLTAIATYPIKDEDRGDLRKYPKLKFL